MNTRKTATATAAACLLSGALLAGCGGSETGVATATAGSTSASSTTAASPTSTPTLSSLPSPATRVTVTDAARKASPNAGTAGPWAVNAAQAMATNEKVMQCPSLEFSKLSIKDFQYLFAYMDNYGKRYTEQAWTVMESFNKDSKTDLDHLTRLRSITMFCADFEGYGLRSPAVSVPQVRGAVTVDVDPTNQTYQGKTLLKVSMTTTQSINVTQDTDSAPMVVPMTRKVTYWLIPDAAGSGWRIHQYGGSYEMTAAVPDTAKP